MHFSNFFLFPPKNTYGIIVLKITPKTIVEVHNALLTVINRYNKEKLEGTLIIIDRNKYRIIKFSS